MLGGNFHGLNRVAKKEEQSDTEDDELRDARIELGEGTLEFMLIEGLD